MEETWKFMPFVLSGIKWNIFVSISSFFVSVVLGLLGAYARVQGPWVLKKLVLIYITIFRGIPELVWLFLIYFGGQAFINWLGEITGLWEYYEISQFTSSVVTIGLVMGAYMVETFRGAAIAIPRGQIEAGVAYGLTKARLFQKIIRPQLFRNCYASLTNNWLGLIKATALVSVIGLDDVVRNASIAGRSTGQPFIFLMVAVVFYLVFTGLSEMVFRYLDTRNKAGGWSN